MPLNPTETLATQAKFHVTQPFNRKNRNPPRLTEHPLPHPSTLRFIKYHLLSTLKYATLLQATANCKKALPNPPGIAYRRNASLRDLLVLRHCRTKIPPANNPQELKNTTTQAASLVLFSERVKQAILILQLTKLEKSQTHILPLKKPHIPDRMKNVPPSIHRRDQASTQ